MDKLGVAPKYELCSPTVLMVHVAQLIQLGGHLSTYANSMHHLSGSI